MKKPRTGTTTYFVDESGDPTFYDRHGNLIIGQAGCAPILLLGFISTPDPQAIRHAVLELQRAVISDPYFRPFPSIHRTAISFHATDDLPEVRYLLFKLISTLDIHAHFVVARKIERIFRNSFHASEQQFYDYLISRLFENVLHSTERNVIYFAQRGSRERQAPLMQAIQSGIRRFETKWGMPVNTTIEVQAQRPSGEPCLSIIDYMNWAVYRAFTRGEMHFYRTIEEKVSLLVDLYDTMKYPLNWYNRRNPFDTTKITPL
jgi:hypothetical protein